MNEPEVSVVMSVFNEEDTARDTIESILAQQGVSLELIVVDDGSTDGTGAILDEIVSRDSSLRVERQTNQGLTAALIRGCELARAPLIARHDCGDRSLPDRLAAQKRAFAEDPDLAFSSCWTAFFGPDWEELHIEKGTGYACQPIRARDEHHPRGLVDWPTAHGSVMFRTSFFRAVRGYRRDFRYTQDWDLWYRLANLGTFRTIEEPLYQLRVFPDSLSMAHRRRQQTLVELAKQSADLLQSGQDDADVLEEVRRVCEMSQPPRKRRLAEGHYFLGSVLLKNRNRAASIYLRQAIANDPWMLKAWIRLAQSWTVLGG